MLTAASISVMWKLKCSSGINFLTVCLHYHLVRTSEGEILCSNSSRRFFVNTVGSKLRSLRFMSKRILSKIRRLIPS